MKALIVLIFLALVVSGVVWKMRKSQAEADLARRKTRERLKKQKQKEMTPEMDMVWPVMIRPVTGNNAPGQEKAEEELAMTSIECELSEPLTAQGGGSKKAVG